MIHRATIQRNANLADDPYYNAGVPDYQDHITNQPGLFWEEAARRVLIGVDRDSVLDTANFMVPRDVDIKVNDVLVDITDRRGATTISTGPWIVKAITTRATIRAKVLVVERYAVPE